MELPLEVEVRAAIRERLKAEFDFASDVLQTATGILTRGGTIAHYPEIVVITGMGLLAKACKQYRAICELTSMGLDEPSVGLSRMLCETMLASCFVLRKRVVIKRDGKKLGTQDGKRLTPAFRSLLYLAKEAFENHKIVGEFMKTPKLKRKIPIGYRKIAEARKEDFAKLIGPKWTDLVKKEGYAGVKIKSLSDSLNFNHVYASFYRLASSGVHAADAIHHVQLRPHEEASIKFSISPDPMRIPGILHTATVAMIQILIEANDGFKLSLDDQIADLMKRVREMKTDFPPA